MASRIDICGSSARGSVSSVVAVEVFDVFAVVLVLGREEPERKRELEREGVVDITPTSFKVSSTSMGSTYWISYSLIVLRSLFSMSRMSIRPSTMSRSVFLPIMSILFVLSSVSRYTPVSPDSGALTVVFGGVFALDLEDLGGAFGAVGAAIEIETVPSFSASVCTLGVRSSATVYLSCL